ncbi:MAG TPA: hypothetical protein VHS78_09520 [Candidatus Elarobacter sp.]|jgi:hypothetical protein|nr:hypothetical protein [Candidatus Elarobacter sp.]
MKEPIDVTLDPEWPVAYVRYSHSESDGSLDLVRRADGFVRECGWGDPENEHLGVHVEFGVHGDIIGIEILDIDDPVEIELAKDFAGQRDLAFPANIRAAARVLA